MILVSHVETGSYLLPEIETDAAVPSPVDHLATVDNGDAAAEPLLMPKTKTSYYEESSRAPSNPSISRLLSTGDPIDTTEQRASRSPKRITDTQH